MKILRIAFVIVLVVVAGRTFTADAQTVTETALYSFGSDPGDGFEPYAGLVQGSDGYFYGTPPPKAGRPTTTALCFGSVPAAATQYFTSLALTPDGANPILTSMVVATYADRGRRLIVFCKIGRVEAYWR
jgi:hypothetical protein